jgi:hypothetical protein
LTAASRFATSRSTPYIGHGTYLPGPLQVLPRRNGRALLHAAALRGTQRPTRQSDETSGELALVESMAPSPSCWGSRRHPRCLASARQLDGRGERLADNGGVGSGAPFREPGKPVWFASVARADRKAFGIRVHVAGARPAEEKASRLYVGVAILTCLAWRPRTDPKKTEKMFAKQAVLFSERLNMFVSFRAFRTFRAAARIGCRRRNDRLRGAGRTFDVLAGHRRFRP